MEKLKFLLTLCIISSFYGTVVVSNTVINIIPYYKEIPNFQNKNADLHNNTSLKSIGMIKLDNSNSTLDKALVIARQFLVREENPGDVEVFKRSKEREQQEFAKVVQNDNLKMYSWWMFSKNTTALPSETESAEETTEEEEEAPDQNEILLTTEPVEVTMKMTSKECDKTTTDVPTTKEPEPESETIPPRRKVKQTTISTTTTLAPTTEMTTPTSKPKQSRQRTKRPPRTKRPSPGSGSPENITTPSSTTITTSEKLPNFPLDPFGVKRRFVEIARSVASSTVERVAPVARESARQAGIIALSTAGHVGKLTKNAVENTYINLAKKLNATELLEEKEKTTNIITTTKPHPENHGIGNKQHVHDASSCGGVEKSLDFSVILLGTVSLILLRNVVV